MTERRRLIDDLDDLTDRVVDDGQEIRPVDLGDLLLSLREGRIHRREGAQRLPERLEIEASALEPDVLPLHGAEDGEDGGQGVSDEDVGGLRGRANGGDVLTDERHPGGDLPQRTLDGLVCARGVRQHVGGDGVELRLIAAADELGDIAQPRLRRLEIVPHIECLVDEPGGEQTADDEHRDQNGDDAEHPGPDAATLPLRPSIVDERVVGKCFGHQGILSRSTQETAVSPAAHRRREGRARRPDPLGITVAKDYFRIFVTVPAPTVRPPSRIA